MNEFIKDNFDSVAISPGLAKAQDELNKTSGSDNHRVGSSMISGAASRSVANIIDGANPVSIGDSGGLRDSSSFARLIDRRLREAEVNGSEGVIDVSVDEPTPEPESDSSQPDNRTSDESNPAADDVKPQPELTVASVQPAQPVMWRKAVISDLPRQAEPQKILPKDQSEVSIKQILAERQNELPIREEANSVSQVKKAMEKAAKLGVPVVLYFGASWCGPCKGLKANVLSKMEGSGRESVPAVFLHVDVDKAADGGNAIAKAVGVRKGSSVPELAVLAIDPTDGKFHSVGHHVGAVGYKTLRNDIPQPLSAAYVARSREQLSKNLKQQFERRRTV